MRKLKLLPFILAPMLFMSCATALKLDKTASKYSSNAFAQAAEMDFLGFKADNTMLSRYDYDMWKALYALRAVRQIGPELQANNIADDQSHSYFGLYTLQEIKEYKTDKRYLTFVEVSEHSITYLDKPAGSIVGQVIGYTAAGAGAGIVFISPGGGLALTLGGLGVALASSAGTGKSTMTVNGTYNIYVYDREEGRIVHRTTATVKQEDVYKGNYAKLDELGRNEVLEYYGTLIANEILEKYDEVQSWISSRK